MAEYVGDEFGPVEQPADPKPSAAYLAGRAAGGAYRGISAGAGEAARGLGQAAGSGISVARWIGGKLMEQEPSDGESFESYAWNIGSADTSVPSSDFAVDGLDDKDPDIPDIDDTEGLEKEFEVPDSDFELTDEDIAGDPADDPLDDEDNVELITDERLTGAPMRRKRAPRYTVSRPTNQRVRTIRIVPTAVGLVRR